MKAFIIQQDQAQRYAFIRTAISMVLVTAGPVSGTEPPVSPSLHVPSLQTTRKAAAEWSYAHHTHDTQVSFGKQFHGSGKTKTLI